MYYVNGYNIKVPRGDSADIPFTFTDGTDPYILGEGESVRLDIFPVKGAEPVISKTATASMQSELGTVIFALTPTDTDIPRGEYLYTLRTFASSSAEIDTRLGFPETATFEIG